MLAVLRNEENSSELHFLKSLKTQYLEVWVTTASISQSSNFDQSLLIGTE